MASSNSSMTKVCYLRYAAITLTITIAIVSVYLTYHALWGRLA